MLAISAAVICLAHSTDPPNFGASELMTCSVRNIRGCGTHAGFLTVPSGQVRDISGTSVWRIKFLRRFMHWSGSSTIELGWSGYRISSPRMTASASSPVIRGLPRPTASRARVRSAPRTVDHVASPNQQPGKIHAILARDPGSQRRLYRFANWKFHPLAGY
jgi:hypothetical protein